jgi:hypothetical protein
MSPNDESDRDVPAFEPRRLYLREPGWRITVKQGNLREFCYMTAPGQNYYHRLRDGELIVYSPEERLCAACAQRRGLLTDEPKLLRESTLHRGLPGLVDPAEYDLVVVDEPEPPVRTHPQL